MATAHYGVLERIARGRPLDEILKSIVDMVEGEFSDSLCSIVLYEAKTNTLRHGAVSRLPYEFAIAIDGLPAGPKFGSCGAAAFLGKQVIVDDINTHENWAGAREKAMSYGLRASWSTPIKAPDGEVLGTFAIYQPVPGLPGARDLEAVELATHSAAIAITRARHDEERLHLVGALERRVQQLVALHGVSRLLEDGSLLDEGLLGEVAACLLPALPEGRHVRIRLGELSVLAGADAQQSGGSVRPDEFEAFLSEPFGAEEETGNIDVGVPFSALQARRECPQEAELIRSIARLLSRHLNRVQTEARLAQQRTLLAIASRTAKLGGIRIVLEPWRVHFSDEASEMLELAPGATLDRETARACIHPDHLVQLAKSFTAALATGQSFDAEFEALTRSGKALWIRMVAEPVRDERGEPVELRGALQDVGERRRLEEQFRQAQKMEAVGRLAGGVAHDFNNLLSVILGYSQVAGQQLRDDDPVQGDLKEIPVAVRRASELTGQLLAFSRQGAFKPRIIDLNHVVQGVERMLRRLLGADVEFHVALAEASNPVFADRGQLEQVIMNLVVNARDAMPTGGRISLEVSAVELDAEYSAAHVDVQPGSYVQLAVSDTGEGMDAETRARVFEPFFTTKEQGKGTGLGLSTVWGIIAQSSGHIWVYSEPGVGSTFKVYLPRADKPLTPERDPSRRPVQMRGTETILLVEDDDQLRALTRTVLSRCGYAVIEASHGEEALRLAREFEGPIHVLLTDVVMPKMGGVELSARLAQERPQTKVLFVSGYTQESMTRHGVLSGDANFVAKPMTPQALLTQLREVLSEESPPR